MTSTVRAVDDRRTGRRSSSDAAPGTVAVSAPPTFAGNRIVNVEPVPSVLSTVMSPPMMRQKRRLMASPRPVPPYFRVVEASAWVKSSNNRAV